MRPAVIKVKPDELNLIEQMIMKNQHAAYRQLKGEYEVFRIDFAGETIVAYTSGKIVSNGPRAEAIVQASVLSVTSPTTDVNIIIGSDEAGKGEWLGPLVIAAVALSPEQSQILKSRGVMDSKTIPIERLGELATEIESVCTDRKILLVPPETFNKRFEELHKEGRNLNDLLAWGHSKAIHEVHQGLSSTTKIRIVIDEFARAKTEERLARLIPLETIDLIQRPRAEDEIAVAAASILAREAREKWIDRESARIGDDLREMSVLEASERNDRYSISKIQYLEKMTKNVK